MAVKIISEVWESSCDDPSTLLLLLALADWSNDDAESWPSIPALARKSRLSERSCRYLLRRLELVGAISVIQGGGRRHANAYKIHRAALQTLQPLPPLIQKETLQPLQGLEKETLQNATLNPAKCDMPLYIDARADPSGTVIKEKKERSTSSEHVNSRSENHDLLPSQPMSHGTTHYQSFDNLFTHSPTLAADAAAVLAHLNAVTKRHYSNTRHITERLRSGATTEQCVTLIDWLDQVMRVNKPEWVRDWFNNATPFKEEQFDKYNAEAQAWHAQGRKDKNQNAEEEKSTATIRMRDELIAEDQQRKARRERERALNND